MWLSAGAALTRRRMPDCPVTTGTFGLDQSSRCFLRDSAVAAAWRRSPNSCHVTPNAASQRSNVSKLTLRRPFSVPEMSGVAISDFRYRRSWVHPRSSRSARRTWPSVISVAEGLDTDGKVCPASRVSPYNLS